jgi:integrase
MLKEVTMTKSRNGEGSIRPRETRAGTVYDVQLSVKDRRTGLTKRIFKGGFKTEKLAVAWRNKKMHESEAGQYVTERPITVPQVVEAWMETMQNRAPTTLGHYRRTFRNHIKPRLNVRVSVLDAKVLREFAAGTSKAIAKHGKDGEATNRAALNMVKAALRWAARPDVGLIAVNPLLDVPLDMLGTQGRGEAMSLDEAALLLKAAKGKPSEIAWRLLLETGARRGEITGLNWGDINFRTGVVSIKKIASPETGGVDVALRTKGKARREIPLSPALLALLADLKFTRGASVSDPVVLDSRGRKRASFTAIRYWWKRDCAAAGLVGYTPHSLRHTFATTALANGAPVNVVSSILGHASTAVTTEIYAHVTGSMQREAVLVVADELARITG